MRTLVITITLASIVCAAPLAALDLTIDPPAALPGLPVTLKLSGPEVRTFEDRALALHVRRGSDEFYASWGSRLTDGFGYLGPVEKWLRSGPDELVLERGPRLSGIGWFTDHELAKPGVYEFRIVVCRLANFDFRSGRLDAPGVVAVSAPAQFVVEVPEGVDEEAWNFYKSSQRIPELHSAALVMSSQASEEVWKRFPNSGYSRHIAYVAGRRKSGAEKLKFFEEALKRPLDGAVRDAIEFDLATTLGNDGVEAMQSRKDMKAASQLVAEARLRLERLVESTSSLRIKELAKAELNRVPTPEKLAARALENLTP